VINIFAQEIKGLALSVKFALVRTAGCFQTSGNLASKGHFALARDLPAHGLNAKLPESFHVRPLNPANFATEGKNRRNMP
jgi:hypothetical protein